MRPSGWARKCFDGKRFGMTESDTAYYCLRCRTTTRQPCTHEGRSDDVQPWPPERLIVQHNRPTCTTHDRVVSGKTVDDDRPIQICLTCGSMWEIAL